MAKLIPYTADRLRDYQVFAQKNWPKGYQYSENYLNWLYQENPNRKPNDFILALDEQQQIIGVIHKLRLIWQANGQKIEVPAIHNLIVDKDQRHGSGLFLWIA